MFSATAFGDDDEGDRVFFTGSRKLIPHLPQNLAVAGFDVRHSGQIL
ncbi:hypothetical protein ACFQAT_10920 [Undibacterium arcticum]